MEWRQWLYALGIVGLAPVACGGASPSSEADGSGDGTSGAETTISGTSTSGSPGTGSDDGTTTGSEPSDDDGTGSSSGGTVDPPPYDGPRTTLVHLFEWRWDDIAIECEQVLGPAGFLGVQVSPPQEHAIYEGHPWWERYQPVSYTLASRSGDEAAFAEMVQRCADVGVGIYVDAVLNHMAFSAGEPGSAGTEFEKYDYPGLYGDGNFHDCRRGIEDWHSRYEIHNCELATLPDLATEQSAVREALQGYLQRLLDLGVVGFRLDAAKHVPAEDLTAILEPLRPRPELYQEIIYFGGDDAVAVSEYTSLGRVTEFRYGSELTRVFREGQLAWLEQFGAAWGFAADEDALVFVDNHDNQRGHGAGEPLTYQDPEMYRLSVAFMLAWPYGQAKLMSSYAIEDGFHGPPTTPSGDTARVHAPQGDCTGEWICEHRWDSTLAMVGFRNATDGEPVQHWWTNGNDQIAFARGSRGFFALNREEEAALQGSFQTGLPAGTYCEALSGGVADDGCAGLEVQVAGDGTADIAVGPLEALALHAAAKL